MKTNGKKRLFWVLACVFVVAVFLGMRQIYRIPTSRLFRAVNQGDVGNVEQLAEKGHWFRPFSETELGIAALKAIEYGHMDVLQALLEMEQCILEAKEMLPYSVLVGNHEVVTWLLDSDTSIDLAEEIVFFETRYNLLSLAVAVQSREIVEILLGRGVDVNAYDKDGTTALITAVSRRDPELAKVLLDSGADPNQPSSGDLRIYPLIYAVMTGKVNMVQLLLDSGADPNQPSACDLRIYPLIHAVMTGCINMVQLLIDRGAHLSTVSFKPDGEFIDITRAIAKSKSNEVKRFVKSILEERSDQMTRVIVALNDLETEHLISTDQIATKFVPKDELPNDYIAIEHALAILGKYTKKEIPAFFPLRWSHIDCDESVLQTTNSMTTTDGTGRNENDDIDR